MNKTELETLIDKADTAYYTTGKAIFEDAYYDKLKIELKKIDSSNPRLFTVGATVKDNILKKVKHAIPMGSLDKATNKQEFDDWFRNNLVKKGIKKDCILHASLKLDGGSLSLEYKNGRLHQAVSRGDGNVGEDITANALKFSNIPPVINLDGKLFSGFVRGETLLEHDEWKKIDPEEESNPRNMATGIARRKDGEQSEYLKFYSFRLFDSNGDAVGSTESFMSDTMKKMGFDTSPYVIGSYDDVWKWYEKIQKTRKDCSYWIDGIVIKLNDLDAQISLGESSNRPRGQVAIKFEADGVVTKVISVDIQVGCTGTICPVANFEGVEIGGTTVSRATLCNWDNINTLGICIGDDVLVVKAGDVIPRVMEVVKRGINRKNIEKPIVCPVCEGKIGHMDNISGEESTNIYCLNKNCPAVIKGRIDRYLSSLDIQGIGESVIEAIVNELDVKTPADLYLLKDKKTALANLMLNGKVRFGEKRAEKLIEEIEKKRILTISELIGSLGIFGLGKKRVTLIQESVGGKLDTLDSWFDDTLVDNASDAGVPGIARRVNKELKDKKDYIMSFIENGVEINGNSKKPKVVDKNSKLFCITGSLSSPKKYFHDLIEKSGNRYTDNFTKDLNYLVAADLHSGSAKLKKAEKFGIKVISEKELMEILK